MAVNPMQRKARQSFLLGVVVMLLISGIIIGFLLWQLMQINEKEKAVSKVPVCYLTADVKAGNEIPLSYVATESIDSKYAATDAISLDSLEGMVSKINLKTGTILTADMLMKNDELLNDSLRIQEYNMLVLPTDLGTGDYIDIRLTLPNGQDYIVVSRKRVIQSTENTIFLKMSEEEILTMSNAIVEAYIINGSQLRAIKYVDPGLQNTAIPTYTVSREVLNLIETDANITTDARNALYTRYKSDRRLELNSVLSENMDDPNQKVSDGFSEQNRKAEQERSRYIELLGSNKVDF